MRRMILLLVVAATLLSMTSSVWAASFTVTNTFDSGAGSLRQAIIDANANPGSDTIEISTTGTIDLQSPLPNLSTDMAINGPGPGQLKVRRDSDDEYGIFVVPSGSTVSISGLAISNGEVLRLAPGAPSLLGGGGVYNLGVLTLTDSSISGNRTNNFGGGILNSWHSETVFGVAELDNVTITNNSSEFLGAGVMNDGDMKITNSTISNNGPSSFAGGVYNDGTLTMDDSTLSANKGGAQGGGIMNDSQSSATINNSTISGNAVGSSYPAGTSGGGIYNTNDSALTLNSSTVTNNTANFGGGIYNDDDGSTAKVGGTILAGNTAFNPANHGSSDVLGDFASHGYNLIGRIDDATGFDGPGDMTGTATSPLNPQLRPLAGNGGPTKTHALSRKSPAVNAGDPACPPPATDQRDVSRPQGPRCDIGSYELRNPPPTLTEKADGKNAGWGDGRGGGRFK